MPYDPIKSQGNECMKATQESTVSPAQD